MSLYQPEYAESNSHKRSKILSAIAIIVIVLVLSVGVFQARKENMGVVETYDNAIKILNVDEEATIFTYYNNKTFFNNKPDERYGVYEVFRRLTDLELRQAFKKTGFTPDKGSSIYDGAMRIGKEDIVDYVNSEKNINVGCISGVKKDEQSGDKIRLEICTGRGSLRTIGDKYKGGEYPAYINIDVATIPEE